MRPEDLPSDDQTDVSLMDAFLKDYPYILVTMRPIPNSEDEFGVPQYEVMTQAGGGIDYEAVPEILLDIAENITLNGGLHE